MDNNEKSKIRNIISKYRNKSSNNISNDFSVDSKIINSINSIHFNNFQGKISDLNLIREESE
jgi:hypothetical protein